MEAFTGTAALLGILATLAAAAAGVLVAHLGSVKHLMARIEELTSRVWALQDQQMECRQVNADLKAELLLAGQRLAALETRAGVSPAPPAVAGILVADLKGTILEFSPSLTPVLHYLPEEMVGRPVEALVPPDLLPAFRAAFARGALAPESLTPGKVVLTYALGKGGERVAVTVTLHVWRAGAEGLITATIRQRAQAAPAGPGRGAPG